MRTSVLVVGSGAKMCWHSPFGEYSSTWFVFVPPTTNATYSGTKSIKSVSVEVGRALFFWASVGLYTLGSIFSRQYKVQTIVPQKCKVRKVVPKSLLYTKVVPKRVTYTKVGSSQKCNVDKSSSQKCNVHKSSSQKCNVHKSSSQKCMLSIKSSYQQARPRSSLCRLFAHWKGLKWRPVWTFCPTCTVRSWDWTQMRNSPRWGNSRFHTRPAI
jgi:hypothetical protein